MALWTTFTWHCATALWTSFVSLSRITEFWTSQCVRTRPYIQPQESKSWVYQGLRDLKWVELFFLHQCTFGGPPYCVAFRWSSHGLQCEPSSGSPCGAQHWLCGSPCASQCEPSRLSPCAGCLPPVSPYSRSPTSCMVKAFQGRLWFKVLVIGISSKRKTAF